MAPASLKKRRTNVEVTLDQLKTLGEQLLSSRAHVNNLPRLLSFLSPSSSLEFVVESLLTLQSFFVTILPELHSFNSRPKSLGLESHNKSTKDPEEVYREWLRTRFDDFVNSLIELAVCPQTDETVKDVVLDALMEFVKLGKGGIFQSAIYHKLIYSLVHSASSVQPVVDLLATKFFKFIDVRYFTYTSLAKIAKSYASAHGCEDGEKNPKLVDGSETSLHTLFYIFSHIPSSDVLAQESGHEMWSQSETQTRETDSKLTSGNLLVDVDSKKSKMVGSPTHFAKKLKGKFSKAWISFLKIQLTLDVYKEVLIVLPQIVIPNIANPVLLCDFLTRSYDIGGVISVMSLSSLFILITKHGVEYPKYYDKLYALLTPSIFMARHRSKFLQLLDTSLKSSHVPAYIAAAFTKKLSRLTLSAPPSGSLVIIAIIHNLLRRHPSINFLVHQDAAGEDLSTGVDESVEDSVKSGSCPKTCGTNDGKDLFDLEEIDLAKTNSMRSSLWEVDTMRHHYCPAVSRFVASLETDLTVRAKTSEVTVEDFCSGSYSSIFRDEIKRRIKQVPVAFYKTTPTSLFSESDFAGWSFGDNSLLSNV